MRALELLRQSKLPHNMELQNEKKQLEEEKNQFFIKEMNKLQRQMAKKESKKARSTRRHSHDVPDYDSLYKKFIVELENKKNQNRKHVRAEPFVLETASRTRNCNENHNHDEKPELFRSNSMSRLSICLIVLLLILSGGSEGEGYIFLNFVCFHLRQACSYPLMRMSLDSIARERREHFSRICRNRCLINTCA